MNSAKLVVIIFLSVVQVGCGGTAKPSGSGEPAKPATVALTLNATVKNRLLTIDGKTDLPDGTFLPYEIRHEGLSTGLNYPIEKMSVDGNATVAGGSYSSTIDLQGWPPGKVEVWLAFQTVLDTTTHQPPDIISRFGELGERMEGSNVRKVGAVKRVELTSSVTLKAVKARAD
jgi:hypothetical protein